MQPLVHPYVAQRRHHCADLHHAHEALLGPEHADVPEDTEMRAQLGQGVVVIAVVVAVTAIICLWEQLQGAVAPDQPLEGVPLYSRDEAVHVQVAPLDAHLGVEDPLELHKVRDVAAVRVVVCECAPGAVEEDGPVAQKLCAELLGQHSDAHDAEAPQGDEQHRYKRHKEVEAADLGRGGGLGVADHGVGREDLGHAALPVLEACDAPGGEVDHVYHLVEAQRRSLCEELAQGIWQRLWSCEWSLCERSLCERGVC